MANEIAIKVDAVSKDFILPHEKVSTLKGVFTSLPKRKKKSSEVQHALRDISFEIKKGEFFGVVGRNGSGKSTLLKILAGIYQPTSGTVHTEGKLVPFIELGVGFNGELTGRENVYLNGAMLGFSRDEIEEMYEDIVSFAELENFMDQKLKNYSSGMQVRLAFSLATRAKADILLVDEVLAVGDADFQRKCFEYFRKLKKNKKTVIFVSHDMTSVREYCDRAVLIEMSRIIAAGNADKVASQYTKMFLETTDGSKTEITDRWGDNAITYDKVKFEVVKGSDKGLNDKLAITAQATAHTDVDSPNFGFLVRNTSGQALFGNNTQIKKKFVTQMKTGQRAMIRWEFDNFLSDGTYYVEPAILYNGNVTADWWEEAARVTIRKEERTSYPTHPDMSLEFEITSK